jgi:hypothetical protein
VTLLPGRLSLATSPISTGSLPVMKTIRIVAVAALVANANHHSLRQNPPSLFRQYKRIRTQDYRDRRKDNSRCKLRDLFYF